MRTSRTQLDGVIVIEPERFEDERGSFTPLFVAESFVGANLSQSKRKGTIRGLHFQLEPFAQEKLIRCIKGRIFDVAVDLRPDSSTFKQWVGIELSEQNNQMLLIPEGCGHGFQTLEDQTEVLYFISQPYSPEHERGFRWNDPAFDIEWPLSSPILNERDRNYPPFGL